LEIFINFAGESDYDVARQVQSRHCGARLIYEFHVLPGGVAPIHGPQYPVRARLHGQMNMPANPFICRDYVDYFVATKRAEVRASHAEVTPWELERYLQAF